MKKIITGFLLGLLALGVFPVPALAGIPYISLKEGNIILPGSDVELVSSANDGTLYSLVNINGERFLYVSRDAGLTWKEFSKKLVLTGKPLSLKASPSDQTLLGLATSGEVCIFRNSGQIFLNLGVPAGMKERGEEITSFDISGSSSSYAIVVGVWNPGEKYPEDGIYAWGFSGKDEWRPQGMRQSFFQKGYSADVLAVVFGPEKSVLFLASGDPDGSGSRSEGLFLNMGMLNSGSESSLWNWYSRWPVELAENPGTPPKSSEILSAQIKYDSKGLRVFAFYNTQQGAGDSVFLIDLDSGDYSPAKGRKISVPGGKDNLMFDSMDYDHKNASLSVGVTRDQGPAVLNLNSKNDWSLSQVRLPGIRKCQVTSSSGMTFIGVSGEGSFFGRTEGEFVIPISLLDDSLYLEEVFPSPDFAKDQTLYVRNRESILKVKLKDGSVLAGAERILYCPEGIEKVRVEALQPGLILVKRYNNSLLITRNGGLKWNETANAFRDTSFLNGQLWGIREDGIYQLNDYGFPSGPVLTSGFSWVEKFENGPQGKLLVIGGDEQGEAERIALFDGKTFTILPSLPKEFAYPLEDWQFVYSSDDLIYRILGAELYCLRVGGEWEKILEFPWKPDHISIFHRGVYASLGRDIYWALFETKKLNPVEGLKDSDWDGFEVAVDGKVSLVVLWNSERISFLVHDPFVLPVPVAVAPLTVTPAPTPTPADSLEPSVASSPLVSPKPVPSPNRIFIQTMRPPPTTIAVKPPAVPAKGDDSPQGIEPWIIGFQTFTILLLATLGVKKLFKRPKRSDS
ncbi:MAG: hypothetical protein PHW72_01420 [Candidatus Pacebacteria bacterium]|nr:hypothetical protein [Candidatus Paceibacterota bacterium]